MDVNAGEWMVKAQELLANFGVKILTAILILIIGRWVARKLANVVRTLMEKGSADPMLVKFVGNLTYAALFTFVILAAIAQVGIQTTSFIAVLGAAGLAVGLALQGSLANFASGVLLLIFRPFKVGDFVEGAGISGVVEEVQIFTTTLKTPDNKTIIIPNGQLTAGTITNYSTKPQRRVDMVFGVGYGDDIDKVKTLISDELNKDSRVLEDPAPTIGLVELADSSVNFVVRPWVNSADYWGVYFDIHENIKKRFDAEGVSIPYPQQDLHIIDHTKSDG